MRENIPADETRTERKKRKLRNKIITVAVELFAKHGFDNTTMEQIAEAADVARKTLYNYFPVKEAIADAYVRSISHELAQKSFASMHRHSEIRHRLLTALNNAYGWVIKNPELAGIVIRYRMSIINTSSYNEQEKTGTYSVMATIISQAQAAGEIREDLSAESIIQYINLLRSAITLDWLNDPRKYDLHKEMEKLVDLLLYGISTRRG